MTSLTLLLGAVEYSTRPVYTVIEGYANTPHMDRRGTVIPVSAFEKSVNHINRYTIPLYFNHEYRLSHLLGKVTDAKMTMKGLYIRAVLREDISPKLLRLIEDGMYRFFSIGGRPTQKDPLVPIITEFDVMEVSVTAMPANKQSSITKIYKKRSSIGLIKRLLENF
jgi:HK97 family phage prohead protease